LSLYDVSNTCTRKSGVPKIEQINANEGQRYLDNLYVYYDTAGIFCWSNFELLDYGKYTM